MKTASYLSEIESAVSTLSKRGGAIAVPTDTTYGLICNLQDSDAVDRIYEIKGRDRSKPLIILGAQADSLLCLMAKESKAARQLAAEFIDFREERQQVRFGVGAGHGPDGVLQFDQCCQQRSFDGCHGR